MGSLLRRLCGASDAHARAEKPSVTVSAAGFSSAGAEVVERCEKRGRTVVWRVLRERSRLRNERVVTADSRSGRTGVVLEAERRGVSMLSIATESLRVLRKVLPPNELSPEPPLEK
jgi:hypothetical protein